MIRILLILIALFLFQCSSQKRASNNYLFSGVNNPKAKRGKVKVEKNKSLYRRSTASTKSGKAKINHKSLYKGATGSTKKGKVKINHKSLYKGATSSNKKNVKTSTHKSLYKSATNPHINNLHPKRMNDIQYKSAYKVDKKGKKNKKHFRKKKN
jgi:hypothetical protein